MAPTKSTLCSPSSLALMLEQVPTPQREAYFLVRLCNKKCALSLNKVTEPVTCALIFGSNSHMIPQSPIVRNPFDHHQPNKHGGRHRLIGKDINSFNLCRAACLASFQQRDKLIKTYLLTGDQLQHQHTLKLFLTQKTMIQDTRSILRDVLLDKEAIAGLQCLRLLKMILNKIFRGSRGRILNKKRLIVNVLSACILNSNNNQMSITEMGKQAGLSKHYIQFNKAKSFKKARLIQEGDEKGFELIEPEKTRSKFFNDTIKSFEQWISELVMQNPLKNDMIFERDRAGNVIYGTDNEPIKVQKMLLMASYWELHLYMIDNYKGMIGDNGKILFSKNTLRKLMPKHIKKVGDRYKQMCGCQTCIIFKDMYACLKMWRKKYISRKQGKIDAIHQCSCTLTARQDQLDEYISKVMKDGEITLVRAWDAAAELACPKVEIDNCNGS